MAEFEKWKNPPKANFVISKRATAEGGDVRIMCITACAIATSCCISDVPSQWVGRNFDPPLLPHFSTDLNETQNQERYRGYDPAGKIWLMWDDGKGFFLYTSRRIQITP